MSANTENDGLSTLQSKRPPTLQDVADALKMHKSTVSVALSGKGTLSRETRHRIFHTAKQMGYVPNPIAQKLASGYRNPAVCVFGAGLDTGLGTEKLLLIQRILSKDSIEVPIYICAEPDSDGNPSQSAQLRQVCRQRPRAIICAGNVLDESVFVELEEYQRSGGFVVSYDTELPIQCDQVIFDREHNAYTAARYLLEKGHRKIGLGLSSKIDWLPDSPHYFQTGRIRGFMKALDEFGAPINENWVFQHATYERGGEELARMFIESEDRPTALAIVNDYVALTFMVTVMQHGVRIPHDLSIIGHDNQPISNYTPVPMTSATQRTDEIATAVVNLLQARLNEDHFAPRKIYIKGTVVERDSVAQPSH